MSTYTCQKHEIESLSSYCPSCMAEFESRKSPGEMTVAERIAVFRAIPQQLTIPFDSLHQWITEIMGRDVWTHELAYPELLLKELQDGTVASLADVIGKLPSDRPVFVVQAGSDS